MNSLLEDFKKLRLKAQKLSFGTDSHDDLIAIAVSAHSHVLNLETRSLRSSVVGKSYFEFAREGRTSRAVNSGLFTKDGNLVESGLRRLLSGDSSDLSATEIDRALYTAAISFCSVSDLLKRGDQKTPGTFFEYLCAPLLSAFFGVPPARSLEVLNLDMKTKLPTDFTFDLGTGKPKFHIPVKTSTRERIIQVFAHQRVLDGVYGTGRFLGLPFILTETKKNLQTSEVTEICIPE
ncbi:MAG TPA: hypothetical protein PLA50_05320 [Bacteroidia bacterium]|nr:hypothetical protein [Bacteroidia bacterium]